MKLFIKELLRESLNEEINHSYIGYHITDEKFNEFDSTEHIGNFGTILDAAYFLSDKEKVIANYPGDYLYIVELYPNRPFNFNLDDEEWVSLEFQEKFREQQVGMDNELTKYLEIQNIENVEDIDCIILTNLEYVSSPNIKEFAVLDEKIIKILKIVKI